MSSKIFYSEEETGAKTFYQNVFAPVPPLSKREVRGELLPAAPLSSFLQKMFAKSIRSCYNAFDSMNFLFFDIESANCYENKGKLFSFGYVLCNAQGDILEQGDIVMNPESRFDPFVRKNMIGYPLEEIKTKPTFPTFYPDIQKLFQDTIAIGFDVERDVKYILDDCRRYRLFPFSIEYLDLRAVILAVTGSQSQKLSVEYEKRKGVAPAILHRSDADALLTYELGLALCAEQGISLPAFVSEFEKLLGKSEEFTVNIRKPVKPKPPFKRIKKQVKK